MKETEKKNPESLKKQIFTIWAKILYDNGVITIEECNKAISDYQKIK